MNTSHDNIQPEKQSAPIPIIQYRRVPGLTLKGILNSIQRSKRSISPRKTTGSMSKTMSSFKIDTSSTFDPNKSSGFTPSKHQGSPLGKIKLQSAENFYKSPILVQTTTDADSRRLQSNLDDSKSPFDRVNSSNPVGMAMGRTKTEADLRRSSYKTTSSNNNSRPETREKSFSRDSRQGDSAKPRISISESRRSSIRPLPMLTQSSFRTPKNNRPKLYKPDQGELKSKT